MSNVSVEHFRKLAAHDRWATREVVRALQAMEAAPPRAMEILAHILGTQHTWLSRMRPASSPLAVWPALSLEQIGPELEKLAAVWESFFNECDLDASFTYKNTKGEQYTSRVDDTLTHVFLHGQYHRGQIVLLIRQAGITPPNVDFIIAVRGGHV